ncbi:MAG: T9SS type A sorting domain-containing protein, partial [Bacteroidales bacterium]|nr:T9SS type A sorting domain-containing protein [Candidatus Latescibacterota bacterium]
ISYSLRVGGQVTMRIYDVAGRLVKTLIDGTKDAGPHQHTWDGLNNLGNPVASGIYFYRMDADGFSETKKMILLK